MHAVEEWARKNGLLAAGEDPNQNFPDRDNQIRIFIEQIPTLLITYRLYQFDNFD